MENETIFEKIVIEANSISSIVNYSLGLSSSSIAFVIFEFLTHLS